MLMCGFYYFLFCVRQQSVASVSLDSFLPAAPSWTGSAPTKKKRKRRKLVGSFVCLLSVRWSELPQMHVINLLFEVFMQECLFRCSCYLQIFFILLLCQRNIWFWLRRCSWAILGSAAKFPSENLLQHLNCVQSVRIKETWFTVIICKHVLDLKHRTRVRTCSESLKFSGVCQKIHKCKICHPDWEGEERKVKERNREEIERKGKERNGTERKGKESKGKK